MSATGTSGRRTASRSASPSSSAAWATHATDSNGATAGAAPNIGRGSCGCGVGIDALASPIEAQAIIPPLSVRCGRTPKNAGSHSTRSASLPTSTDPTSRCEPVRDRRVDRVLGDVAAGPQVVGGAVAWQRAAPRLHHVRGLPRADHHLADPAHRLRVRPDHRDRTHVVEDVLGGDRRRPDPALGEGQILGHGGVQVMAHHQHVEVLVDRVDGVRPGRVGRRRQHVGEGGDAS